MNPMTALLAIPSERARCIEHLERVRCNVDPHYRHFGGAQVARKSEVERTGHWSRHDCKPSFNVLSETIVEKTKVPLQKWFLAIALIVNSKQSSSSCQLFRELDLNQASAWYMDASKNFATRTGR